MGFNKQIVLVNLNDTANLQATIYDNEDNPYTEEELVSVEFTIQNPSGEKTTEAGEIEEDGTGSLNYNETSEVGHYVVAAVFKTLEDGTKSARSDFETVDPFSEVSPSPSWIVSADAWSKFEDCFDSEEEGPWLRDMTANVFNKTKMEQFIDDALMDINLQHPPTSLGIDSFINPGDPPVVTTDEPLLAQALIVQLIRHMMRSYVEQPNPVGAQIAWHDRRDYLQRWKEVYTIEYEQYRRMLALYKRRFMGLGQTAGIISSKAGRLLPAPMRAWSSSRGMW